jgi:mitogen-activated protein kinase kinase kinase 4
MILRLLNVTCGREDMASSVAASTEGYLLLISCEDKDTACLAWDGCTLKVAPTAETIIALSHIQVIYIVFLTRFFLNIQIAIN